MAIRQYQKDGKTLWLVYLDLRGRNNAKVRFQKRTTCIASEREARIEEKRMLRELTEKVDREESRGLLWEDVVERWLRQQQLFPTRRYAYSTLMDYEAMLRNWTKSWLRRVASDINRADGRDVIRAAEEAGKSMSLKQRLKNTIHRIYMWGIEERLIAGVQNSPTYGIEIDLERGEKRQEVLSIAEIRTLLRKAQEQNHPWLPIWVTAVLTGCRSGELYELRKEDVELIPQSEAEVEDGKAIDKKRYGFIRVRRGWNVRLKAAGPTKAGYWRNVPVSSELYWFMIKELRVEAMKPSDHLLPHFWEWKKGLQARELRKFCVGNGLPSIKFHTLRACFATQLISTGIPATVVMKICGWKDMKTMQRYIRLAGIDEAGATEVLKFMPTEGAVMERVAESYRA